MDDLKDLSNERIKELLDKTTDIISNVYEKDLNDYEWIFNEITNINSLNNRLYICNQIFYLSHSSNFWGGVDPLLDAYCERINYQDISISHDEYVTETLNTADISYYTIK